VAAASIAKRTTGQAAGYLLKKYADHFQEMVFASGTEYGPENELIALRL
jgi:hypothetical protein